MKTLRRIRDRFYWGRLRTVVEKWCRECQACRARKGPKLEQGKPMIGWTSEEKLSDRTPRFPCCSLIGRPGDTPSSPNKDLNKLEAHLGNIQTSVRDKIKLSRERKKTSYDSRTKDDHFKEGDQVWVCNPERRSGLSANLDQNWERPYTVVQKMSDVIYRVQRSPNEKPKVIHINRLVPYRTTEHSCI
ncbi:hypothetical protein AVEN_131703-1 [Araneus ventricosus]|uniref:RNA-directed DNA polymerase n=1 Tax=Araneus ventricosus TaxID=182803 RepID=A0A4Y2P4A4_ARAVE|nr:hypothetical protein AVEN_131703-1 [Araneus ventricosus]